MNSFEKETSKYMDTDLLSMYVFFKQNKTK